MNDMRKRFFGVAATSLDVYKRQDQGFDDDFSAAITGASSCLGPIIPPSTGMVLYAMMALSLIHISIAVRAGRPRSSPNRSRSS